MVNKLFAVFRILFLICFIALALYISYELGKLSGENSPVSLKRDMVLHPCSLRWNNKSGERLLPNLSVSGGTEGQLTAGFAKSPDLSPPCDKLVSCKTTVLCSIYKQSGESGVLASGKGKLTQINMEDLLKCGWRRVGNPASLRYYTRRQNGG